VPHSIEDQVRLSYNTPHPQAYNVNNPNKPDITEPKLLGKISEAKLPSALDYEAKNKGFVPAPGSYQTPDLRGFPLPEGGKLNTKPPQQRIELDEYPKPAPGAYGVPNDPTQPRMVNGRFSRDPRVTQFIKEQEMRSRGIPAPGAHEVQESMEMMKPFVPEGGRYLDAHKPKSYFDVAPTLIQDNPPPGSYDVKGSVQGNKAVGRVVYRYESATINETKDLITKAVGDANEAPGPGHYALPDPAPLGSVPALKGRTLPYAMPHPYAYNCAPDHTRSFLAPVRSQNNAEQIFGNGWRQGAAAAAKRGGRSKSEAGRSDQVQLAELPFGVGEEEKPLEDGAVQWRSGGFSSLKKSKSTSAVRAPEIDSVVEQGVGKSYPPLAKNRRTNSTFLPMSSRRTEQVYTRHSSEENQRLGHSKWKINKLMEGIQNATTAALEPLDVDKLKQHAMKGLRDKAINRMKLQGVSRDQQEVILEEMNSLLQERSQRSQVYDPQDEYGEMYPGDEDLVGPSSAVTFLDAQAQLEKQANAGPDEFGPGGPMEGSGIS